MASEFKLQDPGEGIHEAEILKVKVSAGDRVSEGDIVLEIETDKAAVEIPAPFTGAVEDVAVEEGDTVEVGDVLMTYSEEGSPGTEPAPAEEGKEEAKEEAADEDDEDSEGERIERRDERTDAGREEPAGEVPEETGGEGKKERKAGKSREARGESAKQGPVPAAPATRRVARELGVDLHQISGSGPGGRVLAEDVRAAAEEEPSRRRERREPEAEETKRPEERRRRPLAREAPPLPDFARWGEIERTPLRSIRRATAQRMATAWSQIPHAMHHDVADITALEDFRNEMKDEIEKRGSDLSLTVLVAKAVVAALREYPRFNASLDTEQSEIILKRYFNLGIAVDTDQGLLVPVLRDVDRKSVGELAGEFSELTERARKGKIEREELRGGTFTITNPGPLGGTSLSPIINYPEVAILGMARARLEPAIEGDPSNIRTVPRLRLPLVLAFDHRVNDGADAARFMTLLVDTLADPTSFVLAV